MQAVPYLVPGSLVFRLFLTPHNLTGIAVAPDLQSVFVTWKRIELFDSNDRNIVDRVRRTRLEQIVEHLAAATNDPADFVRIEHLALRNHVQKLTLGKVGQRRNRKAVTQKTLRRHYDKRLARVTQHLPAKHMKHLRGIGRHAHLHIVFGAQLQKALESGGRMLWPLPLVAVRQQQRQSAQASPLGFARTNELIDYYLGAVDKIAKLAFPNNQCFRIGGAVAVFESKYSLLREQ